MLPMNLLHVLLMYDYMMDMKNNFDNDFFVLWPHEIEDVHNNLGKNGNQPKKKILIKIFLLIPPSVNYLKCNTIFTFNFQAMPTKIQIT